MDELKNENKFLRSQIGRLKALYLTAILAFVSGIISFQIQYIRIFSYYQSTVDTNQEILLNQKFLNSELEENAEDLQSLFSDQMKKFQQN